MVEEMLLYFENTNKCQSCKSMLETNKKQSKKNQIQKMEFYFQMSLQEAQEIKP